MLAFGIVAMALLVDVVQRNDPISVDFHTYVAAGQVGLQEGWSHIYNQGLVALEQKELSPTMVAQPYLSPPTVAFVTAPLSLLPYDLAYVLWAVVLLVAFGAALAWAGVSKGWSRWIAVVGALAPWWVMHAINVGQVVPLEAAGLVIAWRLMRDRRDVLAGVALAAILFKPNNTVLVPFALLFASRFRLFASWAAVSAGVLLIVVLTVGTGGMAEYVAQLRGPLPKGTDDLTLHGALDATGAMAAFLRVVIAGAVFAAAYKLRKSPGLVIPMAIVGSLLVSPYLHASDLCVLAAAGWMVWEERPALSWRIPLVAMWVLASPYLYDRGLSLHLKQWPWLEIVFLVILVVGAWWPLTSGTESRRRAPA
ncbi:MAG TPA: glycosyltransferase family 87 protein [Candidatus Dormibacteraeota bacterium]